MGFRCGIVGLPNVGKSTLFNALTHSAVPASNYPFCTIEPHMGRVPVADPRLEKLAELAPREKVVPAVVEFIDIAGLVKGSAHGEGLGNQFLAQIAEADAILHLVRLFENPQVAHLSGAVDPVRDIEIIETELALKDLQVVSSNLEHWRKLAKGGDKKGIATASVLERLSSALNEGTPIRRILKSFSPADEEIVKTFNLLTAKPVLYVVNITDSDVGKEDAPGLKAVREVAAKDASPVVPISASIECELARLESDTERAEYKEALGIKESGLTRIVRAGYERLNLITFFTAVGDKELRAWAIPKGSTALQAAGKIHTDMARGFIRAEAISFEDFAACGSEAAAREKGKLHAEGKEYPLKDGDILHIRFHV